MYYIAILQFYTHCTKLRCFVYSERERLESLSPLEEVIVLHTDLVLRYADIRILGVLRGVSKATRKAVAECYAIEHRRYTLMKHTWDQFRDASRMSRRGAMDATIYFCYTQLGPSPWGGGRMY